MKTFAEDYLSHFSRRKFMMTTGMGIAGLALARPAFGANYTPPVPNDIGKVENGKVAFPKLKSAYEAPSGETPAPMPMESRVGFAVVALGRLSLEEILPAFAQCKKSKLVALVSGTPEKAKLVAAQYGVKAENVHTYADFEKLKDNPDVKCVYIVLPNAMHREYTERAAKIGKHVLCEKPMATSVEDAKAMVDACSGASVKLMIAYRCQYEPYNLEVIKRAHDDSLGKIRFIEACNTQSEREPDQWRLKKAIAGGGALPDIGLYCLNAARYVSKEEPSEVFAWMSSPANDPRFKEVEERMGFTLKFPSGVVAQCSTSYDAYNTKKLSVRLEKGWMELNDAFAYKGKQLLVAKNDGGQAVIEDVNIGEKNQFSEEIDHMAECILSNKSPRTAGEEGLRDQVIMAALYKAAESGAPVKL